MKSSTFQTVLVIVFIVGTLAAVLIFSGFIKFGGAQTTSISGTVSVWGTLPRAAFTDFFSNFNQANPNLKVSYEEKSSLTFNQDVVEALASGVGPDVVLIPQELLYKYKDKAFVVPFTSYTAGQIKTNFVREAELLITNDGILGFPVAVDPLVLFYNRNLFDRAGIAVPPKTWEDIKTIVPNLTIVDRGTFTLTQSAIALGEFDNITHAKEILSALFMQAGSTITVPALNSYVSTLSDQSTNAYSTYSALDFYTSFVNPSNPLYTWNKGQQSSQQMFLLGKVAMYVGRASELFEIQQKNPNFDFDVMTLPQMGDGSVNATYGEMTSAVVLKATKNVPAAYYVAAYLSGSDAQKILSANLSLPSPRRDLLAIKPPQGYAQTFYASALLARGWIDPLPDKTNAIFRDMISAVNSGRESIDRALTDANEQIKVLFPVGSVDANQ